MENRGCGRRRFLWHSAAAIGVAALTRTVRADATPAPGISRAKALGRPIAQVTVNGQGPFRFVFDSAASTTAVSGQLLLALGIKPVPDATVTVNSSNGSSEHTTIAIDRLQCGPLSVENLQLPLLDRYALPDADGLLGIAGLGPYRVDIDLKRLAARVVESRDDRVGREWHALKIRAHASGLALVDVRIAGVKCVAVVDTGAERSVGNHALRAALGSTDTPRASTNATTVLNDANGTAQVAVLQLVEELTLGRALLPRGAMAFASAPVFRSLDLDSRPALLLGLDRLRAFSSMALDYRHSRLLLEKLKP